MKDQKAIDAALAEFTWAARVREYRRGEDNSPAFDQAEAALDESADALAAALLENE